MQVFHHFKRLMLKDEEKSNIDFQLIHGDFTALDWQDSNVVFINSTCFDDVLMEKITNLAEKTRPGTFFMTTTSRSCTTLCIMFLLVTYVYRLSIV